MRIRYCLLILLIYVLVHPTSSLPAQAPAQWNRVMISEVSWGVNDGIEITNFAPFSISISGWTVRWSDPATGVIVSSPLSGTLAAGEIMVMTESTSSGFPETPSGIRVEVGGLPRIYATNQSICVGLLNAVGAVQDEVCVANTQNQRTESPIIEFDGWAQRANSSGSAGSVERVWGADSNSGADWTGEAQSSMGLQNRNSGTRGRRNHSSFNMRISEIDDNPDLIELQYAAASPGGPSANLRDWFLVVGSNQQSDLTTLYPFPTTTFLAPTEFIVIGETPSAPSELPVGVTYIDVNKNIPFIAGHGFTCALYDDRGHLVDMMRTAGTTNNVLHNFPRAPSTWRDFKGTAPRDTAASGVISLVEPLHNLNRASEWRPSTTRTMGSPNAGFMSVPTPLQTFDVRLNSTRTGLGFTLIANAGAQFANWRFSYLFSTQDLNGTGPVAGLGNDAATGWPGFGSPAPFGGTLDGQGSLRFDYLDASVVPGLPASMECIFMLAPPAGSSGFLYTGIIELDQ